MALDENKPVGRRGFFRLGLSELLRPLASAAEPFERAMNELARLDQPPVKPTAPKIPLAVWLRPPGSLPEESFKSTCSRCGQCVRICPAHAIQIDATGAQGNGAPYIDANLAACVVCTGLQCMSVCPTGAIRPTSINDIDMGTAVWKSNSCLRSRGEDCTICVDRCPLGTAAIEIKNGDVAVKPLGCIGCGVCQNECPTTPKSIVVIPIAAKTAGR
jgi:MauM/NapG family ferredoxin protein